MVLKLTTQLVTKQCFLHINLQFDKLLTFVAHRRKAVFYSKVCVADLKHTKVEGNPSMQAETANRYLKL